MGLLPAGFAEVQALTHAQLAEQAQVAQAGLLLDLTAGGRLDLLARLDVPLGQDVARLLTLADRGDSTGVALGGG